MRKAIGVMCLFLLIGALCLWWFHPEIPRLYNRTEWTLFGNGSEWFWRFLQFVIVTITIFFIYRELRISAATHLLNSLTSLNEDGLRPIWSRNGGRFAKHI